MRYVPWPSFYGRFTQAAMVLMIVAGLTSGCDADTEIKPKAVVGIGPVECSVDIDLKLTCSVGHEWMLALGPVKVGLGFDAFPGTNGALILVIKHADGTTEAWKIGDDDRPLCLAQVGNITTLIGRNLIEIAPQVGATIRITDPHETGTACPSDLVTSAPTLYPSAQIGPIVVTVQPGIAQTGATSAGGGGGDSAGTGPTASSAASSPTTAPAQVVVELGGFSGDADLNHYCISKGYKEAYATQQVGAYDNWICRGSPTHDTEPKSGYLDFVDACAWAYQRPIAKAEPHNVGSPYTWSCYGYE